MLGERGGPFEARKLSQLLACGILLPPFGEPLKLPFGVRGGVTAAAHSVSVAALRTPGDPSRSSGILLGDCHDVPEGRIKAVSLVNRPSRQFKFVLMMKR